MDIRDGSALLVALSTVIPVLIILVDYKIFHRTRTSLRDPNSIEEQSRYENAAIRAAMIAVIGLLALIWSISGWKQAELKPIDEIRNSLASPTVHVEAFRLSAYAASGKNADYLQSPQGKLAAQILQDNSEKEKNADDATSEPRRRISESHDILVYVIGAFFAILAGSISGSYFNMAMTISHSRAVDEFRKRAK